MTALKRAIIVGCLVVTATSAVSAQGGSRFSGMAIGVAADLPLGTLDQLVKTGYGISIRSGGSDEYETWQGRSSFTFDRFAGKDAYDNIQFVGFGFDLVHRSGGPFYEFAGLALQSSKFKVRSGNTNPSAFNKAEQDIGFDGGVGLNIGSGSGLKGFIEFSAMTVLTTGSTSSWFPIRLGVRF